ncbi:MAG: hypothetical protein QW292_01240 [Candidatus Parvarchaeota archaeon]
MTSKTVKHKHIGDGSVKRYLFLPSMKELWSIVGKENEYILLKEPIVCSCPSSFFKRLRYRGSCYHETIFIEALNENSYETIVCHDSDIQLMVDMLTGNT